MVYSHNFAGKIIYVFYLRDDSGLIPKHCALGSMGSVRIRYGQDKESQEGMAIYNDHYRGLGRSLTGEE
jgi:hypothetical protein